MEERSLRVYNSERTFFNKIANGLTKMLIPTKIGINGMLISMKRNAVIKAYENYTKENEDFNQEELEELAMNSEVIKKWLEGKEIVKVICVPNRIVNIVIR